MSEAHEPILIERACGGWLAVTQPDDSLRIGVTADTEAEARAAFDEAVVAWERLLALSAERAESERLP
jgi:hypothetical protein